MHVRVVRRGGLAGIALSGEADTAELPSTEVRTTEDLLSAMPTGRQPAPPRHPDGFQYEITFSPAVGDSRSIVLDESEVPDGLRPLIQLALQRGTLS